MASRIIGLTGYARTGKDTVGAYLVEKHGFTRVAFADAVRDAVYALNPIVQMPMGWIFFKRRARVQDLVNWKGWDKAKTEYPEIRALLQRMGTEVGRELFHPDFWISLAFSKANAIHGPVVITDVRFENEANAVLSRRGDVWRIDRAGTGPVNDHASDRIDFKVDTIIRNDGTVEDLYYEVDKLLS